jgi:hypothetical protein
MTAMVPSHRSPRSFDAVVRERAVAIRHEAARRTGFACGDASGVRAAPNRREDWRERQARQQRYEALVCEELAAFWVEGVPQIRERVRRSAPAPEG